VKIKTVAMTAATLLGLAVEAGADGGAAGYNAIAVPAKADVLLAVPFNQDHLGLHQVTGVTGNGVTVAGGLTAGAFGPGHYLRFVDGDGEGLWSTVVGNTANAIQVANPAILAHLAGGNSFRIYPHHTLGSLFPAGQQGMSYVNGTQVLVYENNLAAMTQNKSAAKVAAYTGGGWVGAGVNANTVLAPETKFVLRNNANEPLVMVLHGAVPDYAVGMLVAPAGDLVVGSGYPVPVVLKNSGLAGNQRQVLFYDNEAAGFNKSASKAAAYTTAGAGAWVGAGVTGNEEILPSESVTLRLPGGDAGAKVTIPKPY